MAQAVKLDSASFPAKPVEERDPELDALVDSTVDAVDDHWNQQSAQARSVVKEDLKNRAAPKPCTCSLVLKVSFATIIVLGFALCQLPCQLSKCCKRHTR
ncbi:MAG TPA: hypothetical protein VLG44_00100 [Chlamydiales bacterium]|nr:hypothetical protein [Chlamydiales bacterium]